MTDMQRFIKQVRSARGWSMREMANNIGVTQGAVHQAETGSSSFPKALLTKLSTYLTLTEKKKLREILIAEVVEPILAGE